MHLEFQERLPFYRAHNAKIPLSFQKAGFFHGWNRDEAVYILERRYHKSNFAFIQGVGGRNDYEKSNTERIFSA